jgi:hypothetical protein
VGCVGITVGLVVSGFVGVVPGTVVLVATVVGGVVGATVVDGVVGAAVVGGVVGAAVVGTVVVGGVVPVAGFNCHPQTVQI